MIYTQLAPHGRAGPAGELVQIETFSAGIATWDGNETTMELVQRADRALSQAKKGGRNRTVIAGRELQATLPLEVAASP